MKPRKSPDPRDNAVVEEVRQARESLWKESGGTVAGLAQLVRERSASRKRRKAEARRPKSVSTRKRK